MNLLKTIFLTSAVALFALKGMAQIPAGGGGVGMMSGPGDSRTDSSTTAQLPKSDPRSQSFRLLQLGIDTFIAWDSTLPMVQRYNRARASALPYVDLGYYSSPQRSLWLNPFAAAGLQTGFDPYPFQNKRAENAVFHDAKVPLTRFSYFQGGQGFASLDAMHTQNIGKNWNISLDYHSLNNRELYTGSLQEHLHRGTRLGSFYRSKNGRYRNFLILTWNRARRNENGGADKDSLLYRDDITANLSGVGMNTRGFYYPRLSQARSFYGHRHHLLEQQYRLLKKGPYLFHRADWTRTVYRYSDDTRDTSYYGATYWQSDKNINDSSAWNGLSNRLGAGWQLHRAGLDMAIKTWYSHEFMSFTALNFLAEPDLYYSQGIHGEAMGRAAGLTVNASLDQYFDGYNAGDRKFDASAEWQLFKGFSVHGSLQNQVQSPGLFFRRFFNNHFRILNNFNAIRSSEFTAGATVQSKHWLLQGTFGAGTVDGLIYSIYDATFRQAGRLNYTRLQGRIMFNAGPFYTDHRITLQQYSNEAAWSAPAISTLSSLYFQGKLFKKAMLARFGVDVSYWSSYTAWAYRPDLAWFYISPGGRLGGNYPVADLFFSGEVKTVIVTLKLEHWNNYIVNYGASNAFMSAQNYPIEPLRFMLGVVWRFHY